MPVNKAPNPTTFRPTEQDAKRIEYIKERLGLRFASEVIRRAVEKLYNIVKEMEGLERK